jgi:hypothetical protein
LAALPPASEAPVPMKTRTSWRRRQEDNKKQEDNFEENKVMSHDKNRKEKNKDGR